MDNSETINNFTVHQFVINNCLKADPRLVFQIEPFVASCNNKMTNIIAFCLDKYVFAVSDIIWTHTTWYGEGLYQRSKDRHISHICCYSVGDSTVVI